MRNIKSILISLLALSLLAFAIVTPQGVDAKAISKQYQHIDSSRLEMFENMYFRSNYKNYLLVSESRTDSSYNNYPIYYFCLSDEELVLNGLSASLECDELYEYYRSTNNEYKLGKYLKEILTINDSIYYSSSVYSKDNHLVICILTCCLFFSLFYLTFIIFKLFDRDAERKISL